MGRELGARESPLLRLTLALALVAWLGAPWPASASGYDPLAVPSGAAAPPLDLEVQDGDRGIPIRVYLPPGSDDAAPGPAPLVLFSHGLGGSREGSSYLGRHWAARGYVAVFLQHPGSDVSVWRDVPPRERMRAMREAASRRNFRLRVEDVGAVLDALEVWAEPGSGHALAGRLDLEHVGMSGHSFGALTTQAVSGQRVPLLGARFRDPRVDAAVVMSPSAPRRGSPERAFGQVEIPWLLMTGTRDTAAIGGQTLEDRLAVYPALPPGAAYELVLDGAQHSAFTERPLPGDAPRDPDHHPAILALSTAFWDATLKHDPAARAWLDGEGPRSLLAPADRWQRK